MLRKEVIHVLHALSMSVWHLDSPHVDVFTNHGPSIWNFMQPHLKQTQANLSQHVS